MNLLTTLGIGLLTATSALLLKELKSPIAPLVTLSGGILLLLTVFSRLSPIVAWAEGLSDSLPAVVGETVSKVLAAGVLTSFGADTCNELGAASLATKLELAGKLEILLLSLPLFKELFSRVEVLLS